MNQTIPHWKERTPFTETGRTFGAIDRVLPPITKGELGFIVRGWFFDLTTKVSRPTCRIGDTLPLLLTYSCVREDVFKAFPSIPESKFSGFLASFPASITVLKKPLTISYYGKGEETEVRFALPLPDVPWISQRETYSLIAVVSDSSAISEICQWSVKNKPELIVCPNELEPHLQSLKDETTIRAYPEDSLGDFLKSYLTPTTQVFLFGDMGVQRTKRLQNTLQISSAEPNLRVKTYYVKP